MNTLPERMAVRMAATGVYGDAEAVVLAERARGEEGRARVILEALWQRDDQVWRSDFLLQLSDVPRPERVPYVEQQVGLEPFPPLLYSSAAPAALRRLARALAGQGLLPDLLNQADRYLEAAEYLEAAGALTLAQLMLPHEPRQPGLRTAVGRAWQRLARQRRCVAQLLDAALPGRHLLTGEIPAGTPGDRAVQALLENNPDLLPCAVIAAQLATTQPRLSASADWAARALLSPVVMAPRYASMALLSAERAPPRPMLRADGRTTRETLERGTLHYLRHRPRDVRRLLPLLDQEPRGALYRERREDVALRVLLGAPPQPEAGRRLHAAYGRSLSVVADDPRRYVAYMAQLGPDFAGALVQALREPDPQVLALVVVALSAYPVAVVERALEETPLDDGLGRAQDLRHREILRALFRLPLREIRANLQEDLRQAALDLHRCCRGDRGTCDRLSLPALRQCPVWTPLTWW